MAKHPLWYGVKSKSTGCPDTSRAVPGRRGTALLAIGMLLAALALLPAAKTDAHASGKSTDGLSGPAARKGLRGDPGRLTQDDYPNMSRRGGLIPSAARPGAGRRILPLNSPEVITSTHWTNLYPTLYA